MATRNSPQPRPGTPIENRNFLSPVGFKFGLKRSPAVAFFCNEANIPSIDLGIAEQPSYLKNIPIPGDKIQFGDLSLRFLVDEDFSSTGDGSFLMVSQEDQCLGYTIDPPPHNRSYFEAHLKAIDNYFRSVSKGTGLLFGNNRVISSKAPICIFRRTIQSSKYLQLACQVL